MLDYICPAASCLRCCCLARPSSGRLRVTHKRSASTGSAYWKRYRPFATRQTSPGYGEVFTSLARPGGNITGLSSFVTELAGKRVELLKETIPSMARIGFMQNMGNPVAPPQWEAPQAAARALGMSAELYDVRNQQDIRNAFSLLQEGKLDALSVGIDAVTQEEAALIVELAAQHRLPTAYPSREFVDIGGLLSYGPSYPDLYFRAASMIDKIFKGAKPGQLPVEQPSKLELVINLKTVKALGLAVPPKILGTADEVIE